MININKDNEHLKDYNAPELTINNDYNDKWNINHGLTQGEEINNLMNGFVNLETTNFEEGNFPRKLFFVCNKKK